MGVRRLEQRSNIVKTASGQRKIRPDVTYRMGVGVGSEGGRKRHVRKTSVSAVIPLGGRDSKLANLSTRRTVTSLTEVKVGKRAAFLNILS